MATIAEAFAIAVQHHQAGRLDLAKEVYQRILEVAPRHADVLHLLGVVHLQKGQPETAIDCIRCALAINPSAAEFHSNLGNAFRGQGKLDDAIACYRRAAELRPDFCDAQNNLGNALQEQGKLDDAIACYRRALELKPDYPVAHNNLANVLQELGKLDEAIACYRRALGLHPNYVDAYYNLGNALQGQGKPDEASACYRRALQLKPNHFEAHYSLGNAFCAQGKPDEAIPCYRRALQLNPDSLDAHFRLGNALHGQGRLDEAIASYRRALELKPDYAEAYNNLGNALSDQGKPDEAIACYGRAVDLKPDSAEAHYNLGNALNGRGRFDQAMARYRRALELRPDYSDALVNLGNALNDQGKPDEAIDCYRSALELKPKDPNAHNNLGIALANQGNLDEAIARYRRALELEPRLAGAYINLGNALKDQGRLDEAIACYRRVLELRPADAKAHGNLVYTLGFLPEQDPQSTFSELQRWNREHAQPLAKDIQPHSNDRAPDRPLRIGYVSPDFRSHPVGRFLLPLLETHDPEGFEIIGYSSVRLPDPITDRCRTHARRWHDVVGLSDEELAHKIRQDRVDILVDLTMHMTDNRLLVFARKPAPVQVTYLAYCGTTGLDTIDYRLTDPYLDPPGQDESFYSEQSVRLPETYWCYRPMAETPEPGALPALESGAVTFGCLNNFCKVTAPTLLAWSQVLQALPSARLVLHAKGGGHRDRVRDFLARHHVSSDRLTFVDAVPMAQYLQTWQRIDVALDPYPYNGGTTTCDALWMGVPVVSLAGRTAVGRAGLSVLSNVGLPELVARDREEYVAVALRLARDLPRLSELRATLRARMQASPLMDAPRFARNVEAAYRAMWHRWCGQLPLVPGRTGQRVQDDLRRD